MQAVDSGTWEKAVTDLPGTCVPQSQSSPAAMNGCVNTTLSTLQMQTRGRPGAP